MLLALLADALDQLSVAKFAEALFHGERATTESKGYFEQVLAKKSVA